MTEDKEARLVLAFEKIAEQMAEQTKWNMRFVAFVEQRDAGWTKLHNMEAAIRELGFGFDFEFNKRRAQIIKDNVDMLSDALLEDKYEFERKVAELAGVAKKTKVL